MTWWEFLMRLVRPPSERFAFHLASSSLDMAIARCQVAMYFAYELQGRADDWRADRDPNPFPVFVL